MAGRECRITGSAGQIGRAGGNAVTNVDHFEPNSCRIPAEATPGPLKGNQQMARRRYQRGELFLRGTRQRVWVGRWREDVLQQDGTTRRPYRSVILGSQKDYPTRKLALRLLEGRLTQVNDPAYRARPEATFQDFAQRWQTTVLVEHKPSTQSAMRSHINVT